jgi:hypothetical protein
MRKDANRSWAPLLAIPLLALGLGCSDARPQPPTEPQFPAETLATDYDPAAAGVIEGRVTWVGDVPSVPPFAYRRNLSADYPAEPRLVFANPNAPTIDPKSRAVKGAVLFLRGVDARRARPWDHPPVRVEHRNRQLHVVQGAFDCRSGFVHRGQLVEMVSREPIFHILQARGSAFFSLTFPDPDRPRLRALSQRGLVKLRSGAGYYWMRAYLFVDDHPYYTRTDVDGRYRLPQVPSGRYQLVCWLPNWNVAHHDRDPETTVITRLSFQGPVEQERQVEVRQSGVTKVDFTAPSVLFQR